MLLKSVPGRIVGNSYLEDDMGRAIVPAQPETCLLNPLLGYWPWGTKESISFRWNGCTWNPSAVLAWSLLNCSGFEMRKKQDLPHRGGSESTATACIWVVPQAQGRRALAAPSPPTPTSLSATAHGAPPPAAAPAAPDIPQEGIHPEFALVVSLLCFDLFVLWGLFFFDSCPREISGNFASLPALAWSSDFWIWGFFCHLSSCKKNALCLHGICPRHCSFLVLFLEYHKYGSSCSLF